MKTIKLSDIHLDEIIITEERSTLVYKYIDDQGNQWFRERIDFDNSDLPPSLKGKVTSLKNAILAEVKTRKGI